MASDHESEQQFCAKLGHNFELVMTETGFQGLQCSNCQAFISSQELQALLNSKGGHQA